MELAMASTNAMRIFNRFIKYYPRDIFMDFFLKSYHLHQFPAGKTLKFPFRKSSIEKLTFIKDVTTQIEFLVFCVSVHNDSMVCLPVLK